MGAVKQFDSILTELGDFGRYQIRQYVLLSLPVFFSATFISYVFTAGAVPHRCLLEQCGDVDASSPFLPPWLSTAVPPNRDGSGPSSCSTYTPLQLNGSTSAVAPRVPDTCLFDNSSQQQHCSAWVYDGRERTILTEFSLTCPENAWKLALVGTINSLGNFVGLPVSGYVSDRYGRKTALVTSLLCTGVFGIIRVFSPDYETFLTFEFLEALFSGGIYGTAFILGLELVGPRKREIAGATFVWSYALGAVALGLIAWALRGWRLILLAQHAPMLLFVFYVWLVPESVRWLMSRGRLQDARRIIKEVAVTNRVELSAPLLADIDTWEDRNIISAASLSSDSEGGEEEKELPIWTALKQAFTSRILLPRLANCSFCWVVTTLVYYGLSLNSVSLAGTDEMYVHFIVVSLVEAPAYVFAWIGMLYLGRRKTLCISLLVSGVACLANPFVSGEVQWAQLPLYLIGKFAITSAYDTLYVFTAELFPTRLRTSLLNLCSMMGSVGSMLAPQTSLLSYVSPLLPMLLFGGLALLSGLLALIFPETLGLKLPDSVKEAEALGETAQPEPQSNPATL